MLDQFIDKLCLELHPSFDNLGFKNRIADFDFVRVDGVLQEVCKMLEKLIDFSHENHWQMHDTILVVMQPSFCFFALDELDNFPDELVEDGFIF